MRPTRSQIAKKKARTIAPSIKTVIDCDFKNIEIGQMGTRLENGDHSVICDADRWIWPASVNRSPSPDTQEDTPSAWF
jgi:hypothetical protein